MDLQTLKEKIIRRFNYDKLSPEKQDEAVEFVLGSVIENALAAAIFEMEIVDQDTASDMMDTDEDLGELMAFIAGKNPDLSKHIESELTRLRDRNEELMQIAIGKA
jgi:hypothetical protein